MEKRSRHFHRWRVAFFDCEPWEAAYFQKKLSRTRYKLSFNAGTLRQRDASGIRDAEVLSVFMHSRLGERELASLPSLRSIAARSTGVDHIDLAACAARGIAVTNVPVYGEETVAEYTFALLLALARKIPQSVEQTRHGNFSTKALRGFDLRGKTIGVIGCGHIGQHVIRLARAFGMRVLVSDPQQSRSAIRALGGSLVPLSSLLRKSDILTLHAPLLPSTRHLLNTRNLRYCKRGAVLINTARGGLVETKGLLLALKKGWISNAALDVLEEENMIISEESVLLRKRFDPNVLTTTLENHLLLQRSDVLLTPHNAFNTHEALERILAVTVRNILAFTAGKPENLVPLPRQRPRAARRRPSKAVVE